MRALVLGAGGMAGHAIALHLMQTGHEVVTHSNTRALDHRTHLIDVTAKDQFVDFLESDQYDFVINCVGALVNLSATRKDLGSYLNAYVPHLLEETYARAHTRVIHLSTDCVFSGTTGPYREDSPHDGRSYYDRSKGLGEISNSKDLTLRMSIIGPDRSISGTGLFNWFVMQHGAVPGYTSSIWGGITTIELAKGIASAIDQDLTGVYNLVPEGNISKHDLLILLKQVFKLAQVNVTAIEGPSVNKTLLDTRTDFTFEVLGFEEMLVEMRQWILNHKEEYPHYARKLWPFI